MMPINLAEVLQVSFDLVRRAEQAEAETQKLQTQVQTLQAEIQNLKELIKFYDTSTTSDTPILSYQES